MTATTTTLIRELDSRTGDGLDVRLLWRPHDETVLVDRRGERLEARLAQNGARAGVRGILDGDAPHAGGVQRPRGQRERVTDAGADDHLAR